MLPKDIESHDALAHLSFPDTSSDASDGLVDLNGNSIGRRRFLQMAGALGGSAALSGMARGCTTYPGTGTQPGTLVVVLLGGGNDGFNTFVPYTDGVYYDKRGSLSVPADQVLALDGSLGLNPGLPYLKSLWDQGQVAIVEGIGYPNPDLSHFSSMAKWMSGYPAGAPVSGWLGRWLDQLGTPADNFDAISISNSIPLHVVGANRRATGVRPSENAFGVETEDHAVRLADAVSSFGAAPSGLGAWGDTLAQAGSQMVAVNREVAPMMTPTLPEADLSRELTLAARLINANIGIRVIAVTLGEFDTHRGQDYEHPERMQLLNAGLESFYTTLDPAAANRVALMTFAEFGRRVPSNQSSGTDHGTTNSHVVIGPKVRGGLYGQRPSLTDLTTEDSPKFTVDFRSFYASVLDGWLGGDTTSILGGTFENLGLFRSGPGA
jgi:uncharacterized protein (DUF1501 family)